MTPVSGVASGNSTSNGGEPRPQPQPSTSRGGSSSSFSNNNNLDITLLSLADNMQRICRDSLADCTASRRRRQMVRLQSIKRILEDLQKQIRSLRAASNEELRRTNNNTNLSASNNDSDDDDLEAATQLGEKNILYTYRLLLFSNMCSGLKVREENSHLTI